MGIHVISGQTLEHLCFPEKSYVFVHAVSSLCNALPTLAAHLPLLPFKDSPPTSPLDETFFVTSSFPIELTTVSSLNPADRHCHMLAVLPDIGLCVRLPLPGSENLKEEIVTIHKIW